MAQYIAWFLTINSNKQDDNSDFKERYYDVIEKLFEEDIDTFINKKNLIDVSIHYETELSTKKLIHTHVLVEIYYEGDTKPRLDYSGITSYLKKQLKISNVHFDAQSSAKADRDDRLAYIYKQAPNKDTIYKELKLS